jgi:hypothetical protein
LIIDDVIKNIEEDFIREGVDKSIIVELKKIWESKLFDNNFLHNEVYTTQQDINLQYPLINLNLIQNNFVLNSKNQIGYNNFNGKPQEIWQQKTNNLTNNSNQINEIIDDVDYDDVDDDEIEEIKPDKKKKKIENNNEKYIEQLDGLNDEDEEDDDVKETEKDEKDLNSDDDDNDDDNFPETENYVLAQ